MIIVLLKSSCPISKHLFTIDPTGKEIIKLLFLLKVAADLFIGRIDI